MSPFPVRFVSNASCGGPASRLDRTAAGVPRPSTSVTTRAVANLLPRSRIAAMTASVVETDGTAMRDAESSVVRGDLPLTRRRSGAYIVTPVGGFQEGGQQHGTVHERRRADRPPLGLGPPADA